LGKGETTDKGYINQRGVLAARSSLVEDLYAKPPPEQWMVGMLSNTEDKNPSPNTVCHLCSRLLPGATPMPITPFLDGDRFDPETTRVLGVALEMACIALRTGDCEDDIKQAIATKLIALAKAGECNLDILCEEVVKNIRRPQQWTASEAARSSVLPDS
jgi:hypothetical protein